jgi:hypothetical protein
MFPGFPELVCLTLGVDVHGLGPFRSCSTELDTLTQWQIATLLEGMGWCR